MPDRDGRLDDVVLGYRRPEGYFGRPAAAGKTRAAAPTASPAAALEIEGTEYRLETNNGGNHLHGGNEAVPPNRMWEGRVETNRVVMSLLSEDGDQGYPGTLAVEAVFDFDDDKFTGDHLPRTHRPHDGR